MLEMMHCKFWCTIFNRDRHFEFFMLVHQCESVNLDVLILHWKRQSLPNAQFNFKRKLHSFGVATSWQPPAAAVMVGGKVAIVGTWKTIQATTLPLVGVQALLRTWYIFSIFVFSGQGMVRLIAEDHSHHWNSERKWVTFNLSCEPEAFF